MKKIIKSIACALAASAMLLSSAACSSSETTNSGGASTNMAKVGVIQYATHGSLDNCYQGFKEGLAEGGYVEGENLELLFQNAHGEPSTSDLIGAIATPAAMSAYSATQSSGKPPIVFTAISDPVSAGLVQSLESTGANITGSCDVLPLEAQVKMIRAFLPDAKKIGVLYTTSEPNSVSHLAKLKEIASSHGFEVVEQGITNASEVATGVNALIAKGVDCINNFTDNNVVNNLTIVLQAAEQAKIPVFGSEEEQVKNGCLASEGIDYVALGKETGLMAAKILKGEATADSLPVVTATESKPFYNKEVMEKLGLTLPEEYANATNLAE
ncbi:MAG: ABC transporter substrate-binding protein [Acutalibacteraceae bacterium]|nr:ABC transporter substrate-binding protein [Acutalibacteraceae bacterium]